MVISFRACGPDRILASVRLYLVETSRDRGVRSKSRRWCGSISAQVSEGRLEFHLPRDGTSPERSDKPVMVDVVALAGRRFEALAIDDGDLAMVVSDQSGTLKLTSDLGDPGAPYTEH